MLTVFPAYAGTAARRHRRYPKLHYAGGMGTQAKRDGAVVLVQVRCIVCGRLLDDVLSAPPTSGGSWSHYVYVHLCQRHGEGAGHGNVRAWQERQRRAGKPTDRVEKGRWIQWAELRPAVEEARRTGRTVQHAR